MKPIIYNKQIIERIKWILNNEEYKSLLLPTVSNGGGHQDNDDSNNPKFMLIGYDQVVVYAIPIINESTLTEDDIKDSIPFGLDIIGILYVVMDTNAQLEEYAKQFNINSNDNTHNNDSENYNDDDGDKDNDIKEDSDNESESESDNDSDNIGDGDILNNKILAIYYKDTNKIEFYRDGNDIQVDSKGCTTNIILEEYLYKQFNFIWVHTNTPLTSESIDQIKKNKKDSIYFKSINQQKQQQQSSILLSHQTKESQLISLFNISKTTTTSSFIDKTLELIPYFKVTVDVDDITNLISPIVNIVNNNNTSSTSSTSSSEKGVYDISRLVLIPKLSSSLSSTLIIDTILQSIQYQLVIPNIKYYQFEIPFIPFPLTVGYKMKDDGSLDGDENDDQHKSKRYQYHIQFGLPLDKPLFRSTKSIIPSSSSSSSQSLSSKFTSHIKNIHLNINLESKIGGKISLVQGSYDYYHYLQDHIDDDGWGCAYRSMQTICSWLRYQDYTNRPIPTHHEIQKILVNIHDKPSSFYKSKQWIGAFEITLCLQNLYNIDCKIINVTSGSEVVYKVRELAKHFDKDGGCPIMIGGGVLAYTLLGVDFNDETGEARYLILDPHYTGNPNDIKTIKDKGWCSWKGSNLFRKDAFYNFCLPQIPKEI